MAVSLSCARCRKFIKELQPNEIKHITGDEICMDCREIVKDAYNDVDQAKKNAIGEIKKLTDKYLVLLDQMGRKGVKGE